MAEEEQISSTTDITVPKETQNHDSEKYEIRITGDVHGVIMGDGVTIVMTFLGIAASVSSIAQVILMIVDMHSRKSKKQISHTSGQIAQRGWDEIKEIRVQMNDGSWVQFDSWIGDPEKVKSFLGVFHPSAISPKPSRVVFTLKNGSSLPVTLSDTPGNEKELNELINYLQLSK